ncbi:MAG TPA: pyridoxamine 5'-phosphate oxidase family protein [Candidatus Cybelea sp.]|nr:pyridoxamine 5'-phosphate oxidase family protein [Candidatus Cybelea sp.]
MTAFKPTPRSRIKRLPKRAHYERETVHAVLDAALIAHIGYVIDGAPYVTPTAFWRAGDTLYWHGSSASRMLRTLGEGVPACVAVTHFDGFVLARSGFHHSINYRSVTAFGVAYKVEDKVEAEAALDAFMAKFAPGRWAEARPPTPKELKGTTVLRMEIDEAAAKIRTGPPIDDEADYALPVWAGVLPVRMVFGALEPDPRLNPGTVVPGYLKDLAPGTALDEALKRIAGRAKP